MFKNFSSKVKILIELLAILYFLNNEGGASSAVARPPREPPSLLPPKGELLSVGFCGYLFLFEN